MRTMGAVAILLILLLSLVSADDKLVLSRPRYQTRWSGNGA